MQSLLKAGREECGNLMKYIFTFHSEEVSNNPV